MFRQSLKRFYQTLMGGGRKQRSRKITRRSRPAAVHLAVEALEERALLSTVTLTSLGGVNYSPSTSLADTVSLSYSQTTHRYTLVDQAEAISLAGNFSNPAGNGTHQVSFGDGNIPGITINTGKQNFTLNIEDTAAGAPYAVNLGTFNTGNGIDTVNISPGAHNLDNIQGSISLYQPGVGPAPSLNIYDQSNTAAHTYEVASPGGPNNHVSRSGAAPIYFALTPVLMIDGSSGDNTYNIASTGNDTTLNTGNGQDKVNADFTSNLVINSTLVINEGKGGVDVDLGYVNHDMHHLGNVQVNGNHAGVDNLVVEDSATPYPVTYTLGAGSIQSTDAPAGYSIAYNNLNNNVILEGGTGADTFNVLATNVFTQIVGNGPSTVNVGNNGSVQQIKRNLSITDPPSYVTLNVHDENDNAYRTATLQTLYSKTEPPIGRITGLSSGAIDYRYKDTGSVNLFTPSVGATIDVLSAEVPTNLVASGFQGIQTTVNIGNHSNANGITSTLTITDPPSFAIINVDDSVDSTARTVTLDTVTVGEASFGRITGIGTGAIEYRYADTASLTVKTGFGGATVDVLATGVPVNLVGNGANTTVDVGNNGSVQAINGPLTITNPPSYTTVNVDDSEDATARTVSLDTVTIGGAGYGSITGLAPASIQYKYNDTSSVTIETGSGGASVNALKTGAPVSLIGNAAGPISLAASDAANTWSLTGNDAGTLSSSLILGTVSFSETANLHGGKGADTFVFSDGAGVDGTIDGGGGTNALDYSAYNSSVIVDLQTGAATGVGGGVANIQNVTGGSGTSSPNGGPGSAGVYNILVGNGGNVLIGGNGRPNLLIAGASASTLIGGNEDDILIGGATAYDTQAGLAALDAIMAYWAGTADSYATRVANLLSGNGVPLLDATMVTNNGAGNTMLGNHGGAGEMNLFYGLAPASETTDFNPTIGEVFVNC
jgi:hypothetical protein